jgi:hypothetical protein
MLGYGYDGALSEGSARLPVFLTSTFVFRTAYSSELNAQETLCDKIRQMFNNYALNFMQDADAAFEELQSTRNGGGEIRQSLPTSSSQLDMYPVFTFVRQQSGL